MKRFLATAFGLVVLAFGCGRTELRIGEKPDPATAPGVFDAAAASTPHAIDAGSAAGAAVPLDAGSPQPQRDAGEPAQAACERELCANHGSCTRDTAGHPQCECDRGYAGQDCSSCVVYVDARSQCGTNCGRSWATAFSRLAGALVRAEQRSPCEIWVASGTYYPSTGPDREESIRLRSGVSLYGGFTGRETVREDRDWERNTTVLSGDIGVKGDPSDNAFHVLIGADDAILDGFEISAGRADGTYVDPEAPYAAYPYEQSNGGGIVNREVSPTLENCTFTNNYAASSGGAMFNYKANPNIIHSWFSLNTSPGNGGAMLNQAASPEIIDSTFVRNDAREGGVMYNLDRASPHLLRSVFRQNSARGYGGVIRNQWAPPRLEDSSFVDNFAGGGGGAMYTDYTNTPTVTGCIFLRNRSGGEGGALYNTLSRLRISNSVFAGNVSDACGGAIANGGSDLEVTNCTIAANRAQYRGGALCNREQDSVPPIVVNSILWGNDTDEIDSSFQVPDVTYSVVQGGCKEADEDDAGVVVGSACTTDDRGNRDDDPRFVRAPAWSDAGVFEPDYDLHLASDSPCIDAARSSAAPDQDLEGHARIGKPDMGAYER